MYNLCLSTHWLDIKRMTRSWPWRIWKWMCETEGHGGGWSIECRRLTVNSCNSDKMYDFVHSIWSPLNEVPQSRDFTLIPCSSAHNTLCTDSPWLNNRPFNNGSKSQWTREKWHDLYSHLWLLHQPYSHMIAIGVVDIWFAFMTAYSILW